MMYYLNVILYKDFPATTIAPQRFAQGQKRCDIVDIFQDQIKKNGSDARIKMFGDIPIAAGWWSWLLR